MAGDRDEQRLIDRARRGDREAMREIYERTAERIFRLLMRMTRNRDDAHDLAQDTYLRAFSRLWQFDGRAALSTWLYRIAVNEALQFLRRSNRESAQRRGLSAELANSPDNDAASARIDVEDAMAALPPDDRVILLLRYQEGLAYAEIAEVVDCPPGTVASRLNRARQRLRERLGEGHADAEETTRIEHPTDRTATPGAPARPQPAARAAQRRTDSP